MRSDDESNRVDIVHGRCDVVKIVAMDRVDGQGRGGCLGIADPDLAFTLSNAAGRTLHPRLVMVQQHFSRGLTVSCWEQGRKVVD